MSIVCKLRGRSHGSVGQRAATLIKALRKELAATKAKNAQLQQKNLALTSQLAGAYKPDSRDGADSHAV